MNEKLNLHHLLDQHSYDHAVICTYTFDPVFFEEYCLEKLNSLQTNGNISVIVDYGTYAQAITGPIEHKPKQANIRYLLHPITVPGRFHVKLFLFLSKNKGRLIIGSANFTKPGITSNAEMINYYDYEIQKNEECQYLFRAAFTFLNEVNYRWPSPALTSNLKGIEREAPWLISGKDTEGEKQSVTFLHNLEKPLWNQIVSIVDRPVDTVYVLSRFFDANPNLLEKAIRDLSPAKIKIYTQNGITTLTDNWLCHPLFQSGALEVVCCSYRDEDYIQNLHAKAMVIKKGKHCHLAFGSANFTSSALSRDVGRGNAETLLLITDLSTKDLRPEKLFDPLGNGYRLKDDGTLQTDTNQSVEQITATNKINLHYAELVGKKILVKLSLKSHLDYDRLDGEILFQDETYPKRVSLHHDHDDEYFTEEIGNIAGRLGETSSTMTIEAMNKTKVIDESNPVLIVNLLDIQNGQHVRRERYIREAQQSAIDFFRIFESLIKEGDEEPLITFFNYCDIPILDASRPFYARGLRPIWNGGKGMKSLAEKNLKIFYNLHDAAMNFYTRHYKKLKSHVDHGGIHGVANYLHIFLAMGNVLRSQIERLMQGFEAREKPFSIEAWYQHRISIDVYYLKFKELISCLHDQYLPKLMKVYKLEELKENFAPDLQSIEDLCKDMLKFQSRMDELIKTSLKIKNPAGEYLSPPFFQENVFFNNNWSKYKAEQENKMEHILKLVA